MSFWRLYYHIVWATKNRDPMIGENVEKQLFAYLVSKSSELGAYVYAINGWLDHVHLVMAVPPRLAIADVVKNLKGASSHHINHGAGFEGTFAWQRGYGVLSLGERQKADAIRYVESQKQHHNQGTANAWLEHILEQDEGPMDWGIQHGDDRRTIQEPHLEYSPLDEPAF